MHLHSYVVYASIVVCVYSVICFVHSIFSVLNVQNVHPNTSQAAISCFHDAACWCFASYVKDM